MNNVMTPRMGFRPVAQALLLSLGLLSASHTWAQTGLRADNDFALAAKEQVTREPSGLRTQAELGLKKLVADLGKGLPPGTLPDSFPFDVRDFSDMKGATLGLGFEVYSVHPQQLLAGGMPLEQMVSGNGIWNFVVQVGQHPVGLLEMSKVNGQWVVQGAGGARLAQDVYQAAQTHGGKNAFRFVRIYQATADLLEVRNPDNKARFVPLIAARESLNMISPANKDAALPGGLDVLPALQDAVRKHLAAHITQ